MSAPLTWDELPTVDPEDFTIVTMPARFAALGDVHASIDDVHHSIEPLLEWYERDERDRGLGDMPYPPNYPKMPGEPKRVQPSKDRDRKEARGGGYALIEGDTRSVTRASPERITLT